mgnify:FL=1
MNKICFGCGVKLQSTDKEKLGYVPEGKLDTSKYCMRCFRMMHYGEMKSEETPKDKKEIINKINKDNKFVIFLVDFLNINENTMDLYRSIKRDKLLVINKCELLPKHVNRENIRNFVKEYYHVNGEIRLKGGNNSHGATSILNYLEKNNIKETYIVGMTNAGKSTLINDLIKATNTDISKINVNNKKNTTLDFIRVKLNNGLLLIDSPGIVFCDFVSCDVVDDSVGAYSFNMKSCETLALLDRKYYVKVDSPTPITFYTNLNAKNVAKKVYKNLEKLDNSIEVLGNTDIIIKGIGFISIKNRTKISLNIDPKYLEIRKSIFGGIYENTSNE